MGENLVKYKCGHEAAPTKAYQPWHQCPECYRAKDDATKRNQDAGLPVITGSPSQVRWAEGLRDKARRELVAFQDGLKKIVMPELAPVVAAINTKIDSIFAQTEAKPWIDAKERDWKMFVVQAVLKKVTDSNAPANGISKGIRFGIRLKK